MIRTNQHRLPMMLVENWPIDNWPIDNWPINIVPV